MLPQDEFFEKESATPAIVISGDFTVKAGWTLGPRSLNDYELVYFPAGSNTRYLLDGQTYVLNEPGFIVTPPFQEHTYIFDPDQPTRHLFIHFVLQPQCSPHAVPLPGGISSVPWLPAGDASLTPTLMKHILHLAAAKPAHWEQRSNIHLLSILAEISGLQEAREEAPDTVMLPLQVSKALQYIDKHLHLPLSIPTIAEHVGWTHEHFTRVFVQHMGQTPQQAITHRRVERACQLLIQSEATIKQIAYKVGFQDEHYFSRCFTKLQGITASRYRERFADPRSRHLAPTDAYQASYPLNRFLPN